MNQLGYIIRLISSEEYLYSHPKKGVGMFDANIDMAIVYDDHKVAVQAMSELKLADNCEVVEALVKTIIEEYERVNRKIKMKTIRRKCSECGEYFKQEVIDFGSKELTDDVYDEYCEKCNRKAMR